MQLHRAGTQLTALANPLQAYVQVFQEAVTNLEGILSTAASNGPAPILTAIYQNQIAALQALLSFIPTTAAGVLAAPATTTLANPATILSQILPSPTDPAGGLQSLLAAVQTALGQVFSALTTTVPPILQTAFGDLTSANLEGAINNLLLGGLTALFPLAGLLAPVTAAPPSRCKAW